MINGIFDSFAIASLAVLIITACAPSADYSDPDSVRVGGQASQDVPVRISLANCNEGVNE